jgi:hypothetical protein
VKSSKSGADVTKLKLTFTHLMILKPHYEELIAETASLGQNELWSSTNLYRHLQLLQITFHPSSNVCLLIFLPLHFSSYHTLSDFRKCSCLD